MIIRINVSQDFRASCTRSSTRDYCRGAVQGDARIKISDHRAYRIVNVARTLGHLNKAVQSVRADIMEGITSGGREKSLPDPRLAFSAFRRAKYAHAL